MPTTPSIMSLHFRYRLWIAEMNFDINVLRIFEEYMTELAEKNNQAVRSGIASFKKEFLGFRSEIDELRHEMHLCKMSLGADARAAAGTEKQTPLTKKGAKKLLLTGNHKALKKRYTAYRKNFKNIKKEFGLFEAKWL